MGYVGKYVCYGDKHGGFCFARIVDEVVTNSPSGPKESFVVENRKSCNDGLIRDHVGKSLLRKEMVNLETEVFDKPVGMGVLSDDQLFILAMGGKPEGVEGVPLGLANLLSLEDAPDMAVGEIRSREGKVDNRDKVGV